MPPSPTAPAPELAADLAERIKQRWRAGEPPDAAAACREYPTVARYKSLVIELAYEEYCLREAAGPPPDPAAFCDRFPACRTNLLSVLDGHRLLVERPDLLTTPPAWPAIGTSFEGLDLTLELGRGAFGRAYLAFDPDTARTCVLKLSAGRSAEARVIAGLQHPHITGVYWARQVGPLAAVCMPFVGAATLADVVAAAFAPGRPYPADGSVLLEVAAGEWGRPPAAAAAELLVPAGRSYPLAVAAVGARIADALRHAHACGVAHGDLKPSNVVLGPGGHPCLIDFHLAARTEAAAVVGGTLPYMAPELLAGLVGLSAAVSPEKADLYALGVTLYELLTGRVPVLPSPGDSRAAAATLLTRLRLGPPKVRAVAPAVPAALARVVERCLHHEPARRPAGAAEVLAALDRVVEGNTEWVGRRWRWPTAVGVATAVVGVAVVLGSGRLTGGGEPGEAARALSPTADDHFARGVDYLHAENYASAIAEFHAADRLEKSPRVAAYLAYTLALAGQPVAAAATGEEAIHRGAETAAVHNNIGYSCAKSGRFADAKRHLNEAFRLDPTSRAVRYNRAMVVYQAAPGRRLSDQEAAKDMAVVLAAGLRNSEVAFDAAQVFAASTAIDPACRAKALDCLRAAVHLGKNPVTFKLDPVLGKVLGGDPEFAAVCQTTPVRPTPDMPSQIQFQLVEPE